MNLQHIQREEDVAHRVVETADGVEHVVDLGTDATVDVVDGTAIVVTDEQYELELPNEDAEAFIHNGVLTISMEDSA